MLTLRFFRPAALLTVVGSAAFATWTGCSDTGAVEGLADAASNETGSPADGGADANRPRDCRGDDDPDGLQKHLGCTGLYGDGTTLAADVKAYRPGIEFWSDGAEKQRFFYLPPGTKIDITNFDDWKFPVGTKVWKEFKVGGKRLETRLYWKKGEGDWKQTVYLWNSDESDATRLEEGKKIAQTGKSSYEIPNTTQCVVCHEGRSEPLLGVEAVSLGLPTAQGVTIASLASEGRLSGTPPSTSFTIPEDGVTGAKGPAAFAWLHANCGACHSEMGSALQTRFRARIMTAQLGDGGSGRNLDVWTSGIQKISNRSDDAGVIDYIEPGDPSRSLVSILAGRRAPESEEPTPLVQMPPLVSHTVDTAGVKLVNDWISGLADAGL